ncbi:MAG TPA: SRPBCC family protein [Gemmatimonadales bacterium]|nr:SRPBCC family protein [Gemmatimonadales bacterium]
MTDHGRTIAGALAGAGLMYLLDPDRGARRRALVRDQAVRARHRLAEGAEATGRDLRNRAQGTAAQLRGRFRPETGGDEVLHERVRSALGRAVSHPGAIEVQASQGRVTLKGQVLAHEVDELLRVVRSVRGVSDVSNELEVHASPEGVPALQGGREREARPELTQENWAPATRVLAGAVGGAVAYRGLRGEGLLGSVLVLVGGALVARALTNLPASRLTGIGAGRRAIDVQKAIHVNAPVERVWELWSNLESWPRFMSHLKEVRGTSEGRSHWVARGPAGTSVEWDAITTEWVPNELIAWKSVEGSMVEQSGRVRLRSDERGGTLIEIRMSYNPPAGAIGHSVATLLGVDPRTAMDEDMVRLKSLLEEGKASAGEGQVRLEELPST